MMTSRYITCLTTNFVTKLKIQKMVYIISKIGASYYGCMKFKSLVI